MFRKISLILSFLFACTYVQADLPDVPIWMQKRIAKDLSHYKQGIPSKDLATLKELVYKHKLPVLHVEIIANNLQYDHPDGLSGRETNAKNFITSYLTKLLKAHKIPNVNIFINLNDDASNLGHLSGTKQRLAPIFVFAKNKISSDSSRYILFPDDYTIADRGYGYWTGWRITSLKIIETNKDFPWSEKINMAFWRGKKSDGDGELPRQILINLALKNPVLIDAKFNTPPTQTSSRFIAKLMGVRDFIARRFGLWGGVKDEEFFKYKIRTNLDGATCTFPGFLKNLLSNSVTIKQETSNEQWFYDAVKPWIHYVPVKKDLSDLIEKIEWIRDHDAEAKKIADVSTEFVQNNLMMEHIDIYVVALLRAYAKLQQF